MHWKTSASLTAGSSVKPKALTNDLIVVAFTSKVSNTMPEIRKRETGRVPEMKYRSGMPELSPPPLHQRSTTTLSPLLKSSRIFEASWVVLAPKFWLALVVS